MLMVQRSVQVNLKWNPSCNELNDDFSDKLYELTFDVVDNNCPNTAKSSLRRSDFY